MAGYGKASDGKWQPARIRDAIIGRESVKKLTVLDRKKLHPGNHQRRSLKRRPGGQFHAKPDWLDDGIDLGVIVQIGRCNDEEQRQDHA